MLRVCRFGKGSERAVRASGSSFRPKPRGILQLLPRACREAAMAMTIDCGKLVSKFNSPPAAMSLKVGMTTGPQEEMATPKLGPGAGEMDGVLADALNSRLQQLRQMFLKMEEGRSDPGSLGHDIVKVPVPPGPMLLPPPQPHFRAATTKGSPLPPHARQCQACLFERISGPPLYLCSSLQVREAQGWLPTRCRLQSLP